MIFQCVACGSGFPASKICSISIVYKVFDWEFLFQDVVCREFTSKCSRMRFVLTGVAGCCGDIQSGVTP